MCVCVFIVARAGIAAERRVKGQGVKIESITQHNVFLIGLIGTF